MAPVTQIDHYRQVLSMALEDRSQGYQDLVSTNSAFFAVLKRKGLWKPYSGPRIRERLLIDKMDGQWYNGFDLLANKPIELFNDAYFTPKMAAVPITISNEEILNNEGENQLLDTMESYLEVAEGSMVDMMDAALHADGSANGGKAVTGLNAAVPILPGQGVYGGISRADVPKWRTSAFDAQTAFPDIGTQINKDTIRPFLNRIMTQRSRGRRHADLLLMSPEHYEAYDAATTAIQRISKEGGLAKLGFSSLEYIGGGKRAEIVLDGGIGSNMPANTTYGLDTDSMRFRYNPNRNFDKLFPGDGLMPINQDAIAQFIGFMGELTNANPLFSWRLFDSNPAE
ncbi:phage major capsid protein [Brucella pituitosa]|uniref:phage major capsid protein n=1 Tax=Brucella pituitosa TaxID=571256 RepID=UPI002003AC73|nr:phage major capsid protein [Brucella pituitosa]MCK4207193.1 phage major capsid protein [Brucella pituitosa]